MVDTVVYLMDMVDTEVVMGCTDLEMKDTEVGGSNSDYGLGYGGYGGSNGGNR